MVWVKGRTCIEKRALWNFDQCRHCHATGGRNTSVKSHNLKQSAMTMRKIIMYIIWLTYTCTCISIFTPAPVILNTCIPLLTHAPNPSHLLHWPPLYIRRCSFLWTLSSLSLGIVSSVRFNRKACIFSRWHTGVDVFHPAAMVPFRRIAS